ncbi:unnamed protein product [Fraxinus pennsylvanica]|uniref:Wall-associated receptor kinase galacturonan-binding domain-containing protein n=1 Tax=Fraxinus pennsylvanica TaxID=56036 RepID=A0AAD1ZTL7_9LAMI|nr:unnamed protein product [Fraxinus pennsylvanica]
MALTTSKRLHLAATVILTYAVRVLALKGCPNCGSTPVPYPLSTAPDCGDQSYKIRCNATSLFFDTLDNTYPITSISPTNQRLTIEPSPFLANTCITSDWLASDGLQLNSSAPFNITSSNTVFFLNCSIGVLNTPLDCTSNNLCHKYINGTAGSGCVDTQVCCALQAGSSVVRYNIGFKKSGCGAYRSFVNLDDSLPVSRWPAPGVELEWRLPREPTCGELGDCDSGSTCSPDPNSNGAIKRCFCNSGLQWDSVVGQCIKVYQGPDKDRIALITGLTTGLGISLLAALIRFLFYMRHQRIKKEQERLTREQLLTSQKVVDFNREEDDVSLAAYVQRLVEEERIMDVVDPMLTRTGVSNMGFQSIKALGFLAVRCLNEHTQNRPSMKEVAEEIEYIISVATIDVTE